jgi:hypothetical protein
MKPGSPPQTEATAPVARTRPWLIASAVAISSSMLAIVVLHLVSARNPVLDALSRYAFSDQAPGLLAVSILLVAIGSMTTLGALAAAGAPLSPAIRVLFGSWSGGLTLAAAFPASFDEYSNPVSGEIHQYACLVAFLSIPAAGFALLDRLRAVPSLSRQRATLSRWTRYSTTSLLLFGTSYLLAKYPDVPVLSQLSTILPVGLTQRVTLIVDIGLICSMLLVARAASASARGVIAATQGSQLGAGSRSNAIVLRNTITPGTWTSSARCEPCARPTLMNVASFSHAPIHLSGPAPHPADSSRRRP